MKIISKDMQKNFNYQILEKHTGIPKISVDSVISKSKKKISCGNLTTLSTQNFSTIFLPNPSMLKASFDIKCFNFSTEIFSQ